MATTIKLKNGSGAPLAGDLVQGEPALDLTNKRLYTEDSGGAVIEVGTNPSTLTVDTDVLVVDATNNRVGVGTASPAVNLHVNSAADTYLLMSTSNATADNRILFRNSAGTDAGGLWYATNNNSMQFRTNSAERMQIDSSGDVGIGVAPAFTAGGSRKLLQIANSTNGAQIAMSNSSSESENPRIFSDSTNLGFATAATGSGMFQFYTAGTERMRIDSTGHVGIGTTSPSTYDSRANNLVVGDSGDAGLTIFSGATSNAYLQFAPSGDTGLNNGLIDYDNNDDSMAFATGGTERMRIDSSGHVSIGTNSPWSDARLTVDNGGSGAVSIALSRSGAGQNDVALVNDAGEFIVKSGAASTVGALTEHMRVDASGQLGVGTSNPQDKLHVYSGASGGSPHSYTQLLVENSTHQALEFLSPNTSEQAIWFSDPDTSTVGGFSYYHPTNVLAFRTSNDWRMDLSATSAATTLNILSGTEGLIQFKNGGTVKGYINVPNTRFDIVAGTGSDIRLVPDGAGGKAVTVDTSGNVLVGTTTNPSSGKVAIEYARGTSAGMRIKDTVGSGGTGVIADFYNSSNTSVGSITHNSSTTSYNPSSDARLKEKIRDYDNALADVMKLKPRKYSWKVDGAEDNGFIAQELLETPEFANRVNPLEDGDDPMYGVDYMKFVAVLTGAIQEQQAMIEELKAEVAALKGA